MIQILITILCSILIILLIPKEKVIYLRQTALMLSFGIFLEGAYCLNIFNSLKSNYQVDYLLNWLSILFDFDLYFAIDGLSIFFILLTLFLIPVCILISWNSIIFKLKFFLILLFLIEFALINVFSILDLIFFYIFFELTLIPVFLIVGIWGSLPYRLKAAWYIFFYTLIGAFTMLIAILLVYSQTGSTNINEILFYRSISLNRQYLIWILFFLSLMVKLPVFPFHIWLPLAHVYAPTAGSVLLAGIMLKIGGYGLLRILLPLCPIASTFFAPFVFVIALISILYSSIMAISNTDLKGIIAYSSVAHMNMVLLGIFSFSSTALEGALFLMISHGIVSSALFICIGFLYERYGTRNILYYTGLATFMPKLAVIFGIFSFANISLPSTSGFIGEVLVCLGLIKVSIFCTFIAMLSMIFGAIYSLWLYNRIFFGSYRLVLNNDLFFDLYSDLNKREVLIIIQFIFLLFFA